MSHLEDWKAVIAKPRAQALIALAIDEDLGDVRDDATTRAIFPTPTPAVASLVARSETVVCGLALIEEIVTRFDREATVSLKVNDGDRVPAMTELARIEGDVRAILTAERCILNFLMRLCGVAHATRRAVDARPPGSKTAILDTRKTLPGWRVFDKAAVRTGGGVNHREGLFDGVIIKDNHIAAAGSISDAVAAARKSAGPGIFIEVEVDTLEQLDEALQAEPDLILIDNFSLDDTRTAVERSAGRIPLEASGGMREERIAEVAGTGVERISMGAITHSALPADLALDFPGSPR
ncbi:MAG: carboxylating nicotinate-nucleotide diphosphorylase [Myxococcota bacterium]